MKIKFTDAEIAKLNELQGLYHLAILQRSSNPDHFYANVTLLERFAAFNRDFAAFVEPYFARANEAVKSINNTPGDLISRTRAYYLAKKADAFVDAVYAFIFSEKVQADIDQMFAKEPRIIDFAVNGHTRHEVFDSRLIAAQSEKTIPDYTIIFSDNSALIFHSFDNEKELQECRIAFDTKMHSLAAKSVPAHKCGL